MPQFFAHTAGVPDEEAVSIALDTVASKAQTALIDACVAYQEQDFEAQHHASIIPATLCTQQHHLSSGSRSMT